jgi:hypothetical protein
MSTLITRTWAMPNPKTFSIKPISDLLDKWLPTLPAVIIDPFAKDSLRGTVRNDLSPVFDTQYHMEAVEFCRMLQVEADAVLFDPPYSPRQISESYKAVGLAVGMKETQNGRFYKEVRDALNSLLRPGGIAISCGWNSAGFGKTRGYEMVEILLVAHGGAHNDTIVTVERKNQRHTAC